MDNLVLTAGIHTTHLVQSSHARKYLAAVFPYAHLLRATLKAGTVEWWNGGKWPQILKHGTAENDPKS